ncbi:MAG: M23 family metallopeptidase [Acidobacteriota bacterium]|nr:M23 family metallopeptidase [Acidobacteriota bacterium]
MEHTLPWALRRARDRIEIMNTSAQIKRTKTAWVAMAAFILFLLSTGLRSEGAEGGAMEDFRIVLRHRALQPGEVIYLKAQSSCPLKDLRIQACGNEFQAFSEQDRSSWTALVGVDLETRPGSYQIELRGIYQDGKSVKALKGIRILSKKFPVRELKVDEKFVTPPAEAMARIEEERHRVNAIFASVTPEKLWTGPFRAPVPGQVISAFGKRNVYNGQPRSPHSGVDFRGAVGTRIKAPNGGRVVLATDLYFSGNTVILDHGFGLYSYLAHMSEISVKEGDEVDAGSLVGKVGATGRVTGPHLHWTVRICATRVDPLSLMHVFEDSEKIGQAKKGSAAIADPS